MNAQSSPTVTPAELGSFLDTVASAPVALRDVPRINSILARLVGLANSKHSIGEVAPASGGQGDALPAGPVPAEPSTAQDDRVGG